MPLSCDEKCTTSLLNELLYGFSINRDNIIRQLPDKSSNLLTNMTDKNLLKDVITKINTNLIKLSMDESSVQLYFTLKENFVKLCKTNLFTESRESLRNNKYDLFLLISHDNFKSKLCDIIYIQPFLYYV